MKYVGLHTQQALNNLRSIILICLFPCLVLLLAFLFSVLLVYFTSDGNGDMSIWDQSMSLFLYLAPYLLGGVVIWFMIAYFANTAIIQSATGARPLEHKENKRFYNLEE